MVQPISCPSCYSLNKPGATRCRVCAAKLRDTKRPTQSRPVLLERVMSGEVFTAIIGGNARRGPARDDTKDREALAREAAELEEYRRALREFEAMLRTKAITAGRRFERYEPPRRRRRRKEPSEDAIREALAPSIDAMRDRRFAEAVGLLRRRIEDDDEDPRTWILLGEANLRIGEHFEAAAAFHRALDMNPRNERGWLGLAKSLREAGELPAALSSLDRAMALHRDSPETWAERGLVLEALRNLPEALRSFAKAIELRPDYEAARARHAEIEEQLLAKAKESESVAAGARVAADASDDAAASAAAEALLELERESASPPGEETPLDDDLDLDEIAAGPSPRASSLEALEPTPEPSVAERVEARPTEPVSRGSRVRTYVDGLDEALDGGIPKGHVVLLEGAPGTLKSSLGFSILLNNADREGRHGVYLTLEERAESLLRQMASLGLPLPVERGSLVFLDPRTAKDLLSERADWVAGLRRALEEIKANRGFDLLVIDGLEALEVLAKFTDRRREIYRLFEWLRDLGVTAFVVTERPDWMVGGHVLQGRWDEDFLADGVIQLRLHMVSDLDVQRRVRVVKMRGTKHETGYFALVLDEGRLRVTRAMGP